MSPATFDFGPSPEVSIQLDMAPVSLQGAPSARQRMIAAVRDECAGCEHLFSGEVAVEVRWTLHERRRWDSPGVLRSPDVDNIVKPIVDGLCGPNGIMIDDCQVQSLHCSWIDWLAPDRQRVDVQVRPLHPDDIVPRDLIGVERADGLCWVLPRDLSPDVLTRLLEAIEGMRDAYERAIEAGVPEHDARYVLPIGRPFHPAQLRRHGFEVVTIKRFHEIQGSRHEDELA